MMIDFGLEFWRTSTLYVVATGQTLFVLLYGSFPWYRTFLGRALFHKALVLAVLVDLGLFARTHPLVLPWDPIFIVLYGLLGVGVWFQFFAFLKVRTEGRRAEREERIAAIGCEDPTETAGENR